MNINLRAGILSGTLLSLAGCATVMNGTSQPLSFQSTPNGAEVLLVNGMKCTTPCKFELKRGNDSKATITLTGYEPATVYIQSRAGGGKFGNILAGGLIGGAIDGANGSSNHLYPNPVYIKLAAAGSGEKAMLLDKKGEPISTLDDYNATVRDDVNKGLEGQGMYREREAGKSN